MGWPACSHTDSLLNTQVTHNVACLARWMAADLYLREVDVLRFEVGHLTMIIIITIIIIIITS